MQAPYHRVFLMVNRTRIHGLAAKKMINNLANTEEAFRNFLLGMRCLWEIHFLPQRFKEGDDHNKNDERKGEGCQDCPDL